MMKHQNASILATDKSLSHIVLKRLGLCLQSIFMKLDRYTFKERSWQTDQQIVYFEAEYTSYLTWLTGELITAVSVDQVIATMFSQYDTGRENYDFCGITAAYKKPCHNSALHEKFSKFFYQDSTRLLKESFDQLIETGIIPPTDSQTISLLFIQSTLVFSDMHTQQTLQKTVACDLLKTYDNYKQLIVSLLKNNQSVHTNDLTDYTITIN